MTTRVFVVTVPLPLLSVRMADLHKGNEPRCDDGCSDDGGDDVTVLLHPLGGGERLEGCHGSDAEGEADCYQPDHVWGGESVHRVVP
ncbi:MAG: hypothetical protein RL591_519 [Planctomycetota bacterium]